jgi:putative component of toxin-antitoxin plasmid stabilization module
MVPPQQQWTAEVFATDDGFEPYSALLDELSDTEFAALDAAVQHVLLVRGITLGNSEWLKPLGDGLHEFRVRHSAEEIAHMFGDEIPGTAPTGPVLLRVFVHFYGNKMVLLLSGYDKGDDPSEKRQQREIKAARKALRAWQRQQDRQRARQRRPGARGGAGRRH